MSSVVIAVPPSDHAAVKFKYCFSSLLVPPYASTAIGKYDIVVANINNIAINFLINFFLLKLYSFHPNVFYYVLIIDICLKKIDIKFMEHLYKDNNFPENSYLQDINNDKKLTINDLH